MSISLTSRDSFSVFKDNLSNIIKTLSISETFSSFFTLVWILFIYLMIKETSFLIRVILSGVTSILMTFARPQCKIIKLYYFNHIISNNVTPSKILKYSSVLRNHLIRVYCELHVRWIINRVFPKSLIYFIYWNLPLLKNNIGWEGLSFWAAVPTFEPTCVGNKGFSLKSMLSLLS